MIINGDTSIMVPATLYLKILGAVSHAQGFLEGSMVEGEPEKLAEIRVSMLELLKEKRHE